METRQTFAWNQGGSNSGPNLASEIIIAIDAGFALKHTGVIFQR